MPKSPLPPSIPVSTAVQDIINAFKDYTVIRETEVTKRTQIKANRDIALEAIQSQAKILKTLIENTFSERSKNFEQYFTMLDDGFATGNNQKINAALTLIVAQTKISPMTDAIQLINKINDPGHTDIIEI